MDFKTWFLPSHVAEHGPKSRIRSFAIESLPDDEFLMANIDRVVDREIEQVPMMLHRQIIVYSKVN